MPISLGDILELMDALSDLHEQADARLTWPVSDYMAQLETTRF
ncbi:MAG: hypothetical protein ABI680_00605 [Chthoniobacteraceae bacterium]